jgi:predicted DNA-binding antitoxin AbrB/MazE fold protein
MDKIVEENKTQPKKAPKKKVSLKDGPKRTISVQLPPEVRSFIYTFLMVKT